jgi:hypothetical protein
MPAGSEDLILKISADTAAVASGLAPMTTALDNLKTGADEAGDKLSTLDGLTVAPTVDDAGLKSAATSLDTLDTAASGVSDTLTELSRDKVSPPVDASAIGRLKDSATDAGKQLGKLADPVTLTVREQAIERAQDRIEDLKDEIAEQVEMGVDTKDALREMSTLERTVRELTEEPQTIDVEVNPEDADFAFESMAKLKRGVRSLTDAVISAGDGIKALPDLVSAGVGSFTTLNASMSEFLEKQQAVGAQAGRFTSGLGRVTGFLAGPWGLAIAGGITVLGAMVGKMNEADEATKDFAKSLDYQTGALDRNNRVKAANELASKGLLTTIQSLGLSTKDFVDALAGDELALARVHAQLTEIEALHPGAIGEQGLGFAAGGAVDLQVVDDTLTKVNTLREEFGILTSTTSDAAQNQRILADAIDGVAGPATTTAAAIDTLAGGLSDTGGALTSHEALWLDYSARIGEAQSELDKLVDSLDLFNGRTATAREATAKYEEDVDALTQALKDNGATTKDYGKTLDLSSAKGRANQAAIIRTAQDIETLRKARLKDMETSGESTEQITEDYQKQKDSLIVMADKLGLSKTAAEKYVNQLLKAPDTVDSTVNLKGVDKADAQLDTLTKDRTASVTVKLNVDKWSEQELRRRAQNIAAGNIGAGANMYAPPPPTPTPYTTSPVFLQPRIFLDSRPIRAAMRADVSAAVSSTLAATRTRGRL